jgi:hypothetical protein
MNDPVERLQRSIELNSILAVENEIGHIAGFGDRLVYTHLKNKGHHYTRAQVAKAICEINPEGVECWRNIFKESNKETSNTNNILDLMILASANINCRY